ncbi:hypothetical protein V8E55_010082 [Tylopilus felleus]
MADPAFEVRPDFASNTYHMVREAVMAAHNIDIDEAIDRIAAAWQLEHDQRRRLQEAEVEREHREAEKKKPKISDFNEDQPPPNVVAPRPSQYAFQKLSSFEYVELWYFSQEGCLEASRNNCSQADNTLGITTTHDVLTLRPVASVKASRNAKVDHELSFGNFLQEKNAFLKHLGQAAWPEKHVNALAKFFWNIENHPICDNLNSDPIALHYASRICHRWHDDLKNNSGKIFNVSLINENLMNSIVFEINSSIQNKVVQKVCFIPINPITTVNHLYPPPSSYSLRSITSSRG